MKKTAIREGVTYQTKNGSAARRVIKITNDPSEILDGDPSWTEGWVIYEQVRGAAKGMVRELTLPSFAAWAHSEEATVAATDLSARLAQLEADKAALMAAVRAAVDYDPGLWAYTPFVDALPAHLKEEASK